MVARNIGKSRYKLLFGSIPLWRVPLVRALFREYPGALLPFAQFAIKDYRELALPV